MKKIYLSLNFCVLSFLIVSKLSAQLLNPAPYCELNLSNQTGNMISPAGSATTGDGITNVSLGVLNNNTNGYIPDSTYLYYNSLTSPTLTIGNNYSVSVTFGASFNSEPMYYAVWIDFNRNNNFDQAELIMSNGNSGGEIQYSTLTTRTTQFNVPAGAVPGTTRMRVARTRERNAQSFVYSPGYVHPACFTLQERDPNFTPLGEVEDYNVVITTTVSTVGIETQPEVEEVLLVYPNPGCGYFILDAKNFSSDHLRTGLTVALFGPDGKNVYEEIMREPSIKVNTSELSSGIYRLQVIAGDGTLSVRKVVIYSK